MGKESDYLDQWFSTICYKVIQKTKIIKFISNKDWFNLKTVEKIYGVSQNLRPLPPMTSFLYDPTYTKNCSFIQVLIYAEDCNPKILLLILYSFLKWIFSESYFSNQWMLLPIEMSTYYSHFLLLRQGCHLVFFK